MNQESCQVRRRLAALRGVLELRQKILQASRHFLSSQGFLEVDTPVRLAAPALEDYIDAEPSGPCWLRTSPELHMKRLLAAGYERIFQIGPCFRRGERGRQHLPEFTMLEWYRLGADWRDILADAIGLFGSVVAAAGTGEPIRFRGSVVDLRREWEEVTVEEAFRRHAGVALDDALRDGRFEEVLVTAVEPNLGRGRPTVLSQYPLACSGLSRSMSERPDRAERWELYVGGLEIANACSELVDPDEQAARFAASARLRRAEGRDVYPVDPLFMQALRTGMPPAAGIAVGVDRLIMLLAGADHIADVVAFPEPPV